MNRKIVLSLSLILMTAASLLGQEQKPDGRMVTDSGFYQSVYNLRPVLLKKHKMLLNTQLVFPRFYKMYNPKQQSIGKVPSYMVLNEFYFNTLFTYGLSDSWNIYTVIPVVDIHHYSPMGIQKGVGLGDMQLGVTYRLLGKNKRTSDFLSAELKTTFPTGKSQLTAQDYPTGLGSFRFMLALNGLHKFNNFDLWYTGYYEYRTNHSGITAGDETGLFVTLQKSIATELGEFGLEGGLNTYFNFKDTKSGVEVPNSKDYAVNLYVGGWYKYLNLMYIRFGVPYSIYQNSAWMTKYQVMVQFDFLLN